MRHKKSDLKPQRSTLWTFMMIKDDGLSLPPSLFSPLSLSLSQPLVLDQDCMTLCSRDLRLEKRTLFRYTNVQ